MHKLDGFTLILRFIIMIKLELADGWKITYIVYKVYH